MLKDHEERLKKLESVGGPNEDEIDMTEPEKPISRMKVLEPSRKTQKKMDKELQEQKKSFEEEIKENVKNLNESYDKQNIKIEDKEAEATKGKKQEEEQDEDFAFTR